MRYASDGPRRVTARRPARLKLPYAQRESKEVVVDHGSGESPVNEAPFSDEELTALALAAEPVTTLARDAVPWGGGNLRTPSLLPNWYMPSPLYNLRGRWTRAIVITLIVGFLIIDAFGLCVTSGFITVA
jgi:hypothetical protein